MNADIYLFQVEVGTVLFLAEDPLIEKCLAKFLFCEPVTVLAVYRASRPTEISLLLDGVMIVRAKGWAGDEGRSMCVETTSRGRGRILVCYPDSSHVVPACNLPDLPDTPTASTSARIRRT